MSDKTGKEVYQITSQLSDFHLTNPIPLANIAPRFEDEKEVGIIGTCTEHEKPYFRLTSVILPQSCSYS